MVNMKVRTRQKAAEKTTHGMVEPAPSSEMPDEYFSENPQLQKVLAGTGMAGLKLPLVQERDPLTVAMQRMRSLKKRALVVKYIDPEYRLYMNRSVMDARHSGVEQCAGLRRFPGARLALFAPAVGVGEFDLSELSQEFFERYAASYALFYEPSALDLSAYILTRTDEQAHQILYADEICECADRHPYQQPPPVHGTLCQHDDTPIVCL